MSICCRHSRRWRAHHPYFCSAEVQYRGYFIVQAYLFSCYLQVICEYICKKIPVPIRDFTASPQLIVTAIDFFIRYSFKTNSNLQFCIGIYSAKVIRSFDVNKPGEEVFITLYIVLDLNYYFSCYNSDFIEVSTFISLSNLVFSRLKIYKEE